MAKNVWMETFLKSDKTKTIVVFQIEIDRRLLQEHDISDEQFAVVMDARIRKALDEPIEY